MAPPGVLYAIYIVNKSGGLVYNREFAPMASLSTNDTLRFASIWHSLHAISAQLSPVPGCTGADLLQGDGFDLHCFAAATGAKFLALAGPASPDVAGFLRESVYPLYADYVLKNPFYEAEMPIRCDLFDTALAAAVDARGKRRSTAPAAAS